MFDQPNSKRADYIAGLRQLADLLEQHADVLPLPLEGTGSDMSLYFLGGDDAKSELAAAVHVIPARLHKNDPDSTYGRTYYGLSGRLHGLRISLTAYREAVCERVVIGTKIVAHPAMPAEPERTEVVEQVEWRCHPVLADAEQVTA